MSDDSHNSGPSPNHTIVPSVEGCGIFGVTVDEGNNKEEIHKEDAVPSEEDPAALVDPANMTEEKPQAPAPAEAQSPAEAPAPAAAPSVVNSAASLPESTPEKRGKKKKKAGRCYMDGCRKKVGLTGFECRCGFVFCAIHRYSDAHACTFDYKALARDQISAANPTVSPSKMDKI